MVGFGLRFEILGLDLGCKMWQSTHLWSTDPNVPNNDI